jgi:cytochrome c-type biogenesis protein
MEENVTLVAAFGAGLLSFISPCVLPLIPGYLSYISGMSLDEMRGPAHPGGASGASPPGARRRIMLSSLAFILGFSLVFVALGATASTVGQFLLQRLPIISRIAGVIIIVFGLHTMGVFRIEWLYLEKRIHSSRKPAGLVGAMVVGLAFAFGWTPCIGPILTGIFFLAASKDTVSDGVRLLAVYSLGLGVPFFLTALAVDRFFGVMRRIRRHYRAVEVTSGVLLVAIGLLIFTNKFTVIARWLTPYLPVY